MSRGEIARSATKILGYGGGTMSLMGGTQDFLDGGGGQASIGGQGSDEGGGGPPIPPMSDNPATFIVTHHVIDSVLNCYSYVLTF